jgi:hypothetical protein
MEVHGGVSSLVTHEHAHMGTAQTYTAQTLTAHTRTYQVPYGARTLIGVLLGGPFGLLLGALFFCIRAALEQISCVPVYREW